MCNVPVACSHLYTTYTLSSYLSCPARSADLCVDVADTCVQLHGGWGYMYEYGIFYLFPCLSSHTDSKSKITFFRAFTAARLQPIYGGTNEIMKELIARKIVKS